MRSEILLLKCNTKCNKKAYTGYIVVHLKMQMMMMMMMLMMMMMMMMMKKWYHGPSH